MTKDRTGTVVQGKRRRTSTVMAATMACVALGAAACGSSGAKTTSPSTGASGTGAPAQKATVTIPVLLPETGSEALTGSSIKGALTDLAAEINAEGLLKGANVSLQFIDNQSTPSVAVSAASGLIGKYPFILNGVISNTEIPVNNIIGSSGPVVYNISPAVYPKPGSFIFVGTATTADVAAVSLKFASSQGWNKVALLTTTDPSGTDGRNSVTKTLPSFPTEKLVANETFSVTDNSVSSQMASIAAAKPDVVVIWTTGAQIGTAFQAMRAAGLANTPVIMSYGNEYFAEMKKLSAVLPDRLYTQAPSYMMTNVTHPAAQQAEINTLAASLHSQVGHIDATPSYCDDGLLLAVAAFNHLGLHATASQIRDYIQGLSNFVGVDGIYHFSTTDHRGITGASYGMVEWDGTNGVFKPVSPLGG